MTVDDADDETREYRKSMSSIVAYIRKRRQVLRKKTQFNPDEKFIDIENVNNGDFSLPSDKLEFFYPASKNHINWGYEKDHMATAAAADKKYLKETFPVKLPDVETYFEEREKIALFDKFFPLRFPALYYISIITKKRHTHTHKNLGQKYDAVQMFYGGDKAGNLPQHYNRYSISVLNDVDLPEIVEKLSWNINGVLQIYIAAFCSTLGDANQTNEETGEITRVETCKILYPNAAGHVNEQTEILSPENLETLKDQCEFANFTQKLSQQIRDDPIFSVSNVRFNRLLSYTINVNAFPPGWIFK